MPLEDMHIQIQSLNDQLHAVFTGDFTFTYIPEDVTSMLFPVPPDATNICVWQDGGLLAWTPSSREYPTILPELPTIPMIEWQGPFPVDGAVFRVDYEHDLIKRPEEFIFFYALGTGKYFPTYEKTTTAYFDIALPDGYTVKGVWLDDTPHEYEVIGGHLMVTVESWFGPIINDLIVSLVVKFEGCGVLVQGVECVLFQADANGLYFLDNLGYFQVGDRVWVGGLFNPHCFTICMQGDGCIENTVILPCPRGDLDMDGDVDWADFVAFIPHWLETGCGKPDWCDGTDLDGSGKVDSVDFAVFAEQWSGIFNPGPGSPIVEYEVSDCNMDSLAAGQSDGLRFSVTVEGSYIHFEDMIRANCCADELKLRMTVEDNLITIREIEHVTMPCDCLCDYPTTATLGPFEDGDYLLEVIDVNGSSLGVVEVTIGEPVEPSITYQIDDCGFDAGQMSAAGELRFSVTVQGSYIYFEDMMVGNCCTNDLGLEMRVRDNVITIYEIEYTPGMCWCICDYPVTATLGPFRPGTYILEVYEDWGGFIGSTIVTIAPPG